MQERVIDAAIFDFGGVLSISGRHSDFAARFPDADPELVTRIFVGDYDTDGDHPWHRLERGEITLDENRRLNRAALHAAGIEVTAPPAGAPLTVTFEPSPSMVGLVHELRDHGLRLGVLTSNIAEFRDRWRSMLPFDELFDDIVDSHEVGMRKPNPAIYQLALGRLGVDAGRCAFLDDVESNVDAANRLGMRGVWVAEDPAPAIAEVRTLAGLDEV